MTDSLTRRRFIVSGRVQGVGFRWAVRDWAERLELRGWVRNQPDGTVAAEAQGPAPAVAEFARRLRVGPQGARVDAVETTDLEAVGGPACFDIL